MTFLRDGPTTEAQITAHFKKLCDKHGWLYFKISDRYLSGFPDCIIMKDGITWNVELKRPGKKLKPIQRLVGDKIVNAGCKWTWLDTREKINDFFERAH